MTTPSKQSRLRATGPGYLRIIGGRWRSRQLRLPEGDSVRPTPDRVRETLFNWLQPWIEGAECLDLFAGSGALGLEALSRGAAHAVLVEQNAVVIAALRANVESLRASGAEVVAGDGVGYLHGNARPFDIVFLDPPYRSSLLPICSDLLVKGSWIKPGGLIYLETASDQEPPIPESWTLLRSKQAGQVGYHLAQSRS